MRHVAVLTAGVSRAAKINRIILPAVLQWLGRGAEPDMGLLNWRKLEERFGTDSEYLGFLRDSNSAAQRLCHVLSNSRFLGDALNKSVESVTWLGDDDALMRTLAREPGRAMPVLSGAATPTASTISRHRCEPCGATRSSASVWPGSAA